MRQKMEGHTALLQMTTYQAESARAREEEGERD